MGAEKDYFGWTIGYAISFCFTMLWFFLFLFRPLWMCQRIPRFPTLFFDILGVHITSTSLITRYRRHTRTWTVAIQTTSNDRHYFFCWFHRFDPLSLDNPTSPEFIRPPLTTNKTVCRGKEKENTKTHKKIESTSLHNNSIRLCRRIEIAYSAGCSHYWDLCCCSCRVHKVSPGQAR